MTIRKFFSRLGFCWWILRGNYPTVKFTAPQELKNVEFKNCRLILDHAYTKRRSLVDRCKFELYGHPDTAIKNSGCLNFTNNYVHFL